MADGLESVLHSFCIVDCCGSLPMSGSYVFSLGYGVTKPRFKNSQKIEVLSKLYNICAVVLGVRQENLGPKILRGRGVRGHFKET